MEAKEIMIGDWLRVAKDVWFKKGTIVKVLAVDADFSLPQKGLKCGVRCQPANDIDGMKIGGVWLNYLEPIPLTSEILEKNGFVRREDLVKGIEDSMPFFYVDDESGIDIVIEWRDSYDNGLRDENEQRWSEYWKVDINAIGEYSLTTRRIYVHKLQHALRLCGLNELADNFMV